MSPQIRQGAIKAIVAYTIWGLFPFYWKQVALVPALEVISHRIFWSFVMLVLLARIAEWPKLWRCVQSWRVAGAYIAAALLISANWFSYVWAVNHGFIVETSLGYFINPLMTVVLGVFVFREHLSRLQWIAVGCAAMGVAFLTWNYGRLPWVALSLATTFAGYSLVKKMAPLGAREGLTVETAFIGPIAGFYLLTQESAGVGSFGHAGLRATLFLAGAGVVTTVPLLLFASAVQEVPLTLIGVIQYISPTLQLIAGVLFYGEPFTTAQQLGFGAVWLGVILYTFDGWRSQRQT